MSGVADGNDQSQDQEGGARYLRAQALRVDVRGRRVFYKGEAVRLSAKAFDLLVALMADATKILTKDELIECVWQGRAVSDSVLTTAVKEVRRALKDPARAPLFIETVHGHGYRFLLSVQRVADLGTDELAGAAGWTSSDKRSWPPESLRSLASRLALRRFRVSLAVAGVSLSLLGAAALWVTVWRGGDAHDADALEPMTSIAVAPFDDLSPNQDHRWFADGLADELLNALTQAPDLRVAARTSSLAFESAEEPIAEIAERLKVDHVLEGSVRVEQDRIRVTVQLIRTRDRMHVWSETFDRGRSAAIEVQEAIAAEVIRALGVTLDPEALAQMTSVGARSVAAYEDYLKGLALENEAVATGSAELDDEANSAFERARAADPQFAAAHYRSALYWMSRLEPGWYPYSITGADGSSVPLSDMIVLFSDRIDAAIETSSNPIRRLGYEAAKAKVELRIRAAQRLLQEYARARPHDGNAWSAYADAALRASDYPTAQAAARRYADLARQGGEGVYHPVRLLLFSGASDEAADFGLSLLEVDFDPFTMYQTHRALLWAGRFDEARGLLRSLETVGMSAVTIDYAQLRQACADGDAGRARELGDTLLSSSEGDLGGRWLVLTLLGRNDEAADMLRPLDVRERLPQLASWLAYPFFDPSPYPNLSAVLEREGIERPAAIRAPDACVGDRP